MGIEYVDRMLIITAVYRLIIWGNAVMNCRHTRSHTYTNTQTLACKLPSNFPDQVRGIVGGLEIERNDWRHTTFVSIIAETR